MASVRTQIYLDEKQKRTLEEEAKRKHTSLASLVRKAIDRHLLESIPNKKEPLEKIIAVGKSGLKDVSEKHDDYLYGKDKK